MKNTINLIKMDLELMPTWVALIFLAISGMLMLIPVYPRFISPFYILIFIIQTFSFEAEYGQKQFAAILPITKAEYVRAKTLAVVMYETAAILFTVPFAVISASLFRDFHSFSFIPPNFTCLLQVLLSMSAFNILVMNADFKGQFKVTPACVVGLILYAVISGTIEGVVQSIPTLSFRMGLSAHDLLLQLPFAAFAIIFFALTAYISYRSAARNYEKAEI